MAERLTNKIGYEYEKAKRETQLLEINNKLGKLEDILEKYGIESVEELDELIQKVDALILKASQGARLNKKIEKLQQDRDTWKKACKLACEVLRTINYKIYNEDRVDFENIFYQQAKEKTEK